MAQYDYLIVQNTSAVDQEYEHKPISMAQGSLITMNNSNAPVSVARGTNDYVLVADSAQTAGFKWLDPNSLSFSTWTVLKGGTGATSLTDDSVLLGNGTSAIEAAAKLQFVSGQLRVTAAISAYRITLNPNVIDADTASIYYHDNSSSYKNLLLGGGANKAQGIFIDKANSRFGVFKDPTTAYMMHVGGEGGGANKYSALFDGSLMLVGGFDRSIGIDDTGDGDNLTVYPAPGTTGGDLHLVGGNGTGTDGNIYIGSLVGGTQQGNEIYMLPIKASAGTKYVTIDTNGLLASADAPSSATSLYQLYHNRSNTKVLENTTSETTISTFALSHANWIAGAGNTLYKMVWEGRRLRASGIGAGQTLVALYKGNGAGKKNLGFFNIDWNDLDSEFIIEFTVTIKDATYSFATGMATVGPSTSDDYFLQGDVGRATADYNFAEHGTEDNIYLTMTDDQSNTSVWIQRKYQLKFTS